MDLTGLYRYASSWNMEDILHLIYFFSFKSIDLNAGGNRPVQPSDTPVNKGWWRAQETDQLNHQTHQ